MGFVGVGGCILMGVSGLLTMDLCGAVFPSALNCRNISARLLRYSVQEHTVVPHDPANALSKVAGV